MTSGRPVLPGSRPGRLPAPLLRALRWCRPPRVLRPTREGWWFMGATFGLGLAATNTGNNLLYLLFAMLLGFIVISGFLSEQAHRGLQLQRTIPRAIHAGAPAYFALTVANRKRRLPSFSLHLEEADPATGELRRRYLVRLGAGERFVWTYPLSFPRRGRHRLPGYRVWTRFPFGLFTKATRPRDPAEVLVLPAVHPVEAEEAGAARWAGDRPRSAAGPGSELHALRDFRPGDDPRLVHWKSTARVGRLILRELETEDARRLRLIVADPPPGTPEEAVERDVALAASLAAHWLDRGAEVRLVLPGGAAGWQEAPHHLPAILRALALFQPRPGRAAPVPGPAPAGVADVGIVLGMGVDARWAGAPGGTPAGAAGGARR